MSCAGRRLAHAACALSKADPISPACSRSQPPHFDSYANRRIDKKTRVGLHPRQISVLLNQAQALKQQRPPTAAKAHHQLSHQALFCQRTQCNSTPKQNVALCFAVEQERLLLSQT